MLAAVLAGCSSPIPAPKHSKYEFPKENAFTGEPKRPYTVLGRVRTKVTWPSLSDEHEEDSLCKNYYNKAVRDLIQRARDNGGDAVAGVTSVVFLFDGRQETYPTPECSDDGEEMQILLSGIAIKWKVDPKKPAGVADAKPAEDPDDQARRRKVRAQKSREAVKKEEEFLNNVREDAREEQRSVVPRPQAVPGSR